jgi:colanic acid biosynthesis protein WcaH
MNIPEDLYKEICRSMPIPCVDILVINSEGQVLLLKRSNEPMKDEWWFPGGRVLFKESRSQTVLRKLKEECGLVPVQVTELGTYDMILTIKNRLEPSHAITTLFQAKVDNKIQIKLDAQSQDAQWLTPNEWLKYTLHSFIKQQLFALTKRS